MNRTTIYSASGGYTTAIRAMVRPIAGASMWNTITNVLRNMRISWLCLATSDDELLITSDGDVLVVK